MKLLSWMILSLSIVLFITHAKAPHFFNDPIQAKDVSYESIVTNMPSVVQADTLPPYSLTKTKNSGEPVVFAPGIISTLDDDAHATFSSDGHTVYFVKSTPQFNHWTTVVSHFENGKWNTPEVVSFSGRYRTGGVSFSSDGNTLFFVSNRPVEEGVHKEDTDIWKVEKRSEGWGDPQHIEVLSSPRNEWFPTVTDNGTIYFGSERLDGNLGPEGTTDLWRSRLVNGQYAKPENLGDVINTPGEDIEGYISPDERFLIFSSKGYEDTRGLYDLYISYNQDDEWSEPQNLGDTVNSAGWEFGPKISPDANYLFFTSNRSFFDEPLDHRLNYQELRNKLRGPGNGLRDIYQIDASILPLPPEN